MEVKEQKVRKKTNGVGKMTPLNVLIEAKRRLSLEVEDEYYTFDAAFPSHLSQINEYEADSKILVESDYGQELLERAGVK